MAEEVCEDQIHQNDIGTEFVVIITKCINGVETPIDISTATLKEIVFLKSDGTTKDVHLAVFTSILSGGAGDGSDGQISYFTVLGDLDQLGNYQIQGKVTTPAGKWSSEIDKFKVHKNL